MSSPAFADGDPVPVQLTCDGDEVSPPLAWSAPTAADVAAWAVVVDDPDAPGGTFTHWVLLDVPAATSSFATGEVPDGAAQADNSAGGAGWTGPCPPSGTHHYRFTVYGLSAPTGLGDGASLDDALSAVGDAAVAEGTLVGSYRRR
ncbi:YbhB/YbcL family Raf kinase inhibitor-like protein [Nocardioides guangzhouensis]|uniref:YbhB/YbcL family Raf kinase inhibitor-like protein n=1 Tax=Nocardioides guangzhouensis TaxID=2497878 RepID=A0A4Q4ZHY1_9ACTN|nr:YbhB/YbcL family Raf kinase inhibitor-like protein [Nocardioides guangzhouensis]